MSCLARLVASATAAISQASDVAALDNVRVEYLDKKGHLTFQMTALCELPPEERPAAGVAINEVKEQVQQTLNVCKVELESAVLNACLAEETTDTSLPRRRTENGGSYPVTRTIDRIGSFSGELGFVVATGLEIEDDYHNFGALNVPGHRPVRADHDTLWSDAMRLLCTQTSGMQTHTMKEKQPPIRIIAPGYVYRNDYDQTHTLMFHQMEELIVGTNINFTNLKDTLHDFLYNFLEENLQTRFHPSYFLFTEPSTEVDVMDKNGKWLEVLGCGMVHSNVLRNVGIDPEIHPGLAFGMGIEYLAMPHYGVTDLHPFFENGLRFLEQFR